MSDTIRIESRRRRKRQPAGRRAERPSRAGFLRARALLWLPMLAGLVWAVDAIGTPHLRFAYTYTGPDDRRVHLSCDYVGWDSRRIVPRSGRCPLILMLRPIREEGS